MRPVEFMRLFPEFEGESWSRWREVAERLTGDVSEFFAICGRGSGKSRISALLAVCWACREYKRAPGERVFIGCFGPDRRQARLVYDYILGLLRSRPELEALIEHETRERIELVNGNVIEVITADRRAPRGRTYALVIMEEASMFPVDDYSADPDRSVYEAVTPALGRVEGSLLAVIGTPYRRAGLLWEAVTEGDSEGRIVVTGDTLTFNPSFNPTVIERAFERDPIAAMSEYGREGRIEFRSDVASLLTEEAIAAVVLEGVREVPPHYKIRKRPRAHFDASTGSGKDSAALAIAWEPYERERPAELACVRKWAPPFSPSAVVAEASELARGYGATEVQIDRFAPGLVTELFRENGVVAKVSERDTSSTFVELLGLINSGRVRLLDSPPLLSELRRLERRSRHGGRDRVGHPPGGHDDVAAAAAGALVACLRTGQKGRRVTETLILH